MMSLFAILVLGLLFILISLYLSTFSTPRALASYTFVTSAEFDQCSILKLPPPTLPPLWVRDVLAPPVWRDQFGAGVLAQDVLALRSTCRYCIILRKLV